MRRPAGCVTCTARRGCSGAHTRKTAHPLPRLCRFHAQDALDAISALEETRVAPHFYRPPAAAPCPAPPPQRASPDPACAPPAAGAAALSPSKRKAAPATVEEPDPAAEAGAHSDGSTQLHADELGGQLGAAAGAAGAAGAEGPAVVGSPSKRPRHEQAGPCAGWLASAAAAADGPPGSSPAAGGMLAAGRSLSPLASPAAAAPSPAAATAAGSGAAMDSTQPQVGARRLGLPTTSALCSRARQDRVAGAFLTRHDPAATPLPPPPPPQALSPSKGRPLKFLLEPYKQAMLSLVCDERSRDPSFCLLNTRGEAPCCCRCDGRRRGLQRCCAVDCPIAPMRVDARITTRLSPHTRARAEKQAAFLRSWAYGTPLPPQLASIRTDNRALSAHARLVAQAAEPGVACGPGTSSWGNKVATMKWAAEAALRSLEGAPDGEAPAAR